MLRDISLPVAVSVKRRFMTENACTVLIVLVSGFYSRYPRIRFSRSRNDRYSCLFSSPWFAIQPKRPGKPERTFVCIKVHEQDRHDCAPRNRKPRLCVTSCAAMCGGRPDTSEADNDEDIRLLSFKPPSIVFGRWDTDTDILILNFRRGCLQFW